MTASSNTVIAWLVVLVAVWGLFKCFIKVRDWWVGELVE